MIRTIAALAGSLVLTAPAWAVPLTEWGTTAQVSTANCPSFCTNVAFGPASGGALQSSAATSISDTKGSAAAAAALDPASGIQTPLLRAEAFSGGGLGSAFGTAFGVEGYTNTSGTPRSYTLNILLDGLVGDLGTGNGKLTADLIAWQVTNFFFSSDRATLLFEAGATILDETQLLIDLSATTSASGSISFTLAPGESVYVWALLEADARRDLSSADAFSTLTTSFSDPTGLVAASLPEPNALALLGCAAWVLTRERRRWPSFARRSRATPS